MHAARMLTALLLVLAALVGCQPRIYNPELATRPYSHELHTTNTANMQVFRRDTDLEIVNSTAHSYRDVDLWVNQRYVHHVEALPAGETLQLSLWDFIDEFGDRFYAGGFFRSYPAQPVRLVEIQPGPEQPMIGLITIRSEEVRVREPGR